MSQDARYDEEQSTARRAGILGLSYIDVSAIDNKQLYQDILTLDEMQQYRVIPVYVSNAIR